MGFAAQDLARIRAHFPEQVRIDPSSSSSSCFLFPIALDPSFRNHFWLPIFCKDRSAALCKEASPKNEHICGRPLGLRFDPRSGDLYIADAYLGLMRVGPEGGQASVLADAVDGVPLRFTNDLDIAPDGSVYFTDSSSKYQRRSCVQEFREVPSSVRVLVYGRKRFSSPGAGTSSCWCCPRRIRGGF